MHLFPQLHILDICHIPDLELRRRPPRQTGEGQCASEIAGTSSMTYVQIENSILLFNPVFDFPLREQEASLPRRRMSFEI